MPRIPAEPAEHTASHRSRPVMTLDNEWCVGDEPARWDVGFSAQILEQLRRLWQGKPDPAPSHPGVLREQAAIRRIPPARRNAA